jgi:hypothetical protein
VTGGLLIDHFWRGSVFQGRGGDRAELLRDVRRVLLHELLFAECDYSPMRAGLLTTLQGAGMGIVED